MKTSFAVLAALALATPVEGEAVSTLQLQEAPVHVLFLSWAQWSAHFIERKYRSYLPQH